LAVTVALIVDRFFSELELPAIPSPRDDKPAPHPLELSKPSNPPPRIEPDPRIEFALGVGDRLRTESQDMAGFALLASLGVRFFRTKTLQGWAKLSLGSSVISDVVWPNQAPRINLSYVHFPIGLAALAGLSLGKNEFRAGPRLSADLLYMKSVAKSQTQTLMPWNLLGGIEAEYLFHFTSRVFARAGVAASAAITRHDFAPESAPGHTLFSTPWMCFDFSMGSGISF